MSFLRQTKMMISRMIEAFRPEPRTHIVGQVVSYDPATNTAEIQPVVREIRLLDPNNPTTVDLPVLADVPVMQRGSGKGWVTVAPAVDSYGVLHISDREIESWLVSGGVVDPQIIRIQSINDAIFEPGILPLVADGDSGLIEEPIKTDRVELRTRSGLTEIAVVDDESIVVKNDACTITIDASGNVALDADGAVTVTAGDTVTIDNGSETLKLDGAEVKAGSGSDFAALSAKVDANFSLINTIISTGWVPLANDGGAALKTAWTTTWPGGAQATASSNLKAD